MKKIFSLFLVFIMLCAFPALADNAVENCVCVPGQPVELRYTVSAPGKAEMQLLDSSYNFVQQIFTSRFLVAGTHVLSLDASFFDKTMAEGVYYLALTQNNGTVYGTMTVGNVQTAPETIPEAAEIPEATEEPEITEAPEVTETPETAEPYNPAPACLSEYHPEHENCYWCTPMDITDEEAVWNMLIAPVQVINAGQKEQVVLRAEPSESSEGIGVITGASQAVHVLETRDDGWSLVETYSSSFHDSKVKKWNAFVTGYVKTSLLKTYKVRTDYGLVIDKLTQTLYVFKEGHLFTTLAVSTGLYNESQPYNETRSGEFIIISRVGDFKSDNLICGMALRFNSGDLLHEVPHVLNKDGTKNYKNCEPKLLTRASHGCVRVQRLKNADGINMTWLWNNIKVGTKLVIWEDYAGRTITVPDDSTPLYYNPNGGTSYHSTANCPGVRDKYLPLTAFTYGELEDDAYKNLTRCAYCQPALRVSEIEKINAEHETTSPGMIQMNLDNQ